MTIGESCVSSNNGAINISAQNVHNYTAILTGNGLNTSNSFTTDTSFTNLASGIYKVCFTVEDKSDYGRCFDLRIGQPEELSVSSKINSLNNKLTLNLSGGKQYLITLNGKTYETSQEQITLTLDKLENLLEVKTNLDCQGSHQETIILSEKVLISPNPISSGDLSIYLGNTITNSTEISLFTVSGKQVYRKVTPKNEAEKFTFSMDSFSSGVYLLNIRTEKSLFNFKVIKK